MGGMSDGWGGGGVNSLGDLILVAVYLLWVVCECV